MRAADVTTETRAFLDLDTTTAHDCWRLRQDVFVVEQACAYADLDGRDPDPGTRHVLLRRRPDGEAMGDLVGYLRVLDEGDHARIGRVAVVRGARGRGLADVLMRAGLETVGDRVSVLAAQTPLAGWYSTHGYAVDGPEFLEDGIAHLPMRRPGRDGSPTAAVGNA